MEARVREAARRQQGGLDADAPGLGAGAVDDESELHKERWVDPQLLNYSSSHASLPLSIPPSVHRSTSLVTSMVGSE